MKKFLKINRKTITFILILIAIPAFIFLFCKKEEPLTSTTTAMGTYIQQTVLGKNASEAIICANKNIETLEHKISWRIQDSEIALINKNGNKETIVSQDTLELLSLSLDLAKNSNGAFDITILPVSCLWDFCGKNEHLPTENEINEKLPFVNYNNLNIDVQNNKVFLSNKFSGIDLGAVGKGKACNTAISAYKELGVKYGIISVGGSIGIYGEKDDGSPFKVGIKNPFYQNESENNFAIIELFRGYVSTSGAYERNFIKDGKMYHHILNPKTGYPAQSDMASITVLHNDGTITDLLSTACYVLGKEKSLDLLKHYNAQGILVDNDKNVFATPLIKDKITLTDNSFHLTVWE